MADARLAAFEGREYMITEGRWECQEAKRIEAFQGNENRFAKEPCAAAGLW